MLDITFARSEALYLLLLVPIAGFLGWRFGVKRGRFPRSVNLLRMAIIALLALTLAQPLTTSGGDARTTVFVVDQSNSLTAGSGTDVEAWIDDAIREEGVGNRAAVVAFGSAPVLAQPPTAADDIGDWGEGLTIDAEYTDVESALAFARALPVGGARRIVLVSDGAENLGTALNQVGQAAGDGTPIDVLPLPGIAGDDLRVDGVTAPAAVWSGETINVLTSIGTAEGGSGSIELVVDGAVVSTQAATFQPGLNTFTFPVQDLEPGFHAFEVRVQSADAPDAYADNNVAPFAVVVRDAPKLLLVSPEGSDPGRLQGALERRGAIVTRSLPKDVSSRLSDLGVYDAFVLNNVPAQSLSFDQLTGLQEATRSLGKGLVVIGGTQSYGPGSYAGTILEETLPVTVRVTDGRERQRVALLLIMDKSGSMSYDPLGGSSKIEMAKEAARAAVAALADGDQVGILTFNDTQQWVVQMTLLDGAETRNAINAAIDTITADGGTEIYPALQAGFDAIRLSEADVRHVVLLSDGKSRTGTPESYQALIADTISDRTTLSAIAIGDDSDTVLLDNLANWGNGRYHFADRPEMIPQLTLQEAQSAGSQSVIRGQFTMLQTLPSPILLGFAPEDLPALEGYDYAEAKPGAQVILTSQRDDPILAKWQFGLGRVVAWTGDDGADFALPWTEWSRFDEFWASMIRWTLPDPENRALNVTVERDGPEAVVSVTSVGQSGDYVDSASTTATITGPDGAVTADIPLFQSGPGEYQLRIAAPQLGAYRIDLVQQRDDGEVTEVAGFSMPPSPELQPAPGGGALMQTIAARTGGRVLTLDDPGAAFSSEGLSGTALQTYNARWFVPLALALMLLLLELAIRLQFFSRVRAAFGRT